MQGHLIIPYKYDEQIRGFENLSPMQTPQERAAMQKKQVPKVKNRSEEFAYDFKTTRTEETTAPETAEVPEIKEAVFPHVLGTDSLGRDNLVRLMYGSRISLTGWYRSKCHNTYNRFHLWCIQRIYRRQDR